MEAAKSSTLIRLRDMEIADLTQWASAAQILRLHFRGEGFNTGDEIGDNRPADPILAAAAKYSSTPATVVTGRPLKWLLLTPTVGAATSSTVFIDLFCVLMSN